MRRAPFLVAVPLLLAACGDKPPEALPAAPGAYTGATPSAPVPVEEGVVLPTYVDVTAASGIDFVHETGAYGEKLLPETMGAGCALLDHDGDGDLDLLFVNGDWWPGHEKEGPRPTARLYRNDGAWHFTDVTAEAGLATPFYGMGAAACDTDGDGDTDLFLSGAGGYRLYRNERGVFVDATEGSGLEPGTWTDETGAEHPPFATSAAFLDYDGDGRPDLFVAHYVHWSQQTDLFSTMNGRDKSYAVPKIYEGESCRLFRNLGGNRFEDATDAAGVRNDEGKSLGVCVLDFNGDGRPDIAVANDTQPDYLYRNDGGGRFTEIGTAAGVAVDQVTARARAGMGIDACVLPDSGKPSLVVGNFSGEPASFLELLKGELFINRADVAGVALATHQVLTFGVRFLDADLDGRADIVLANGHIEPTIQTVHKDVTYAQPPLLLRGVAGAKFVRFEDVSQRVGADFATPRVARGVATGDLDGDGDLDLVFTVNGGAPAVLRCDLEGAASRALRVRVRGAAPGTDALGARVVVTCGGRTQEQWVRTGSSYLSQSELALTFGLGRAGRAEHVVVHWPDGAERVWDDVAAGTLDATPR